MQELEHDYNKNFYNNIRLYANRDGFTEHSPILLNGARAFIKPQNSSIELLVVERHKEPVLIEQVQLRQVHQYYDAVVFRNELDSSEKYIRQESAISSGILTAGIANGLFSGYAGIRYLMNIDNPLLAGLAYGAAVSGAVLYLKALVYADWLIPKTIVNKQKWGRTKEYSGVSFKNALFGKTVVEELAPELLNQKT